MRDLNKSLARFHVIQMIIEIMVIVADNFRLKSGAYKEKEVVISEIKELLI